ncbi:MAG: DUF4326 domain-containing protein [Gammaproteobacteria bacterium]|nr:DUF4326 domain-containing protein [Gammaproteobacteria bacterium]
MKQKPTGNIIVVSKRNNGTKAPGDYRMVDISRSGCLGNPYPETQYGRAHCIELFEQNWAQFITDPLVKDELNGIYRQVKEGQNIALQCWCAPLPCHGDVIKEKIEAALKRRC